MHLNTFRSSERAAFVCICISCHCLLKRKSRHPTRSRFISYFNQNIIKGLFHIDSYVALIVIMVINPYQPHARARVCIRIMHIRKKKHPSFECIVRSAGDPFHSTANLCALSPIRKGPVSEYKLNSASTYSALWPSVK